MESKIIDIWQGHMVVLSEESKESFKNSTTMSKRRADYQQVAYVAHYLTAQSSLRKLFVRKYYTDSGYSQPRPPRVQRARAAVMNEKYTNPAQPRQPRRYVPIHSKTHNSRQFITRIPS